MNTVTNDGTRFDGSAPSARIHGWAPDDDASADDAAALGLVLDSSLETCLRALATFRAAAVRDAMSRAQRAADGGLRPELFEWFYPFRRAVRADDASAVDAAVERLDGVARRIVESAARARANDEYFGIPADISGDSACTAETVSMLLDGAREGAGPNVQIGIVLSPSPRVRAFTEEAFALLRRRWPAIEREARIFVQRILFMTGGMMLGATDVHYQGGILLDAEMRSPVRIAEQIVHEAAHTRLNSIVAGRKLVTNPHTERFSTPLRADTRPMLGLFHQMFVLSRLREFFTRVLVEYPDLESHLQGVCTKLRDAVTTIREHGSLTPAGDALVASIERAMP
jgi:hypothetical protein